MRIAFDPQRRFDCPPVLEVRLNTSCRDEIIPILKGLQHIYSQPELRDELLDAVAQDVNGTSSAGVRSRQCQGFPRNPGRFHPGSGLSPSLDQLGAIEREASFL